MKPNGGDRVAMCPSERVPAGARGARRRADRWPIAAGLIAVAVVSGRSALATGDVAGFDAVTGKSLRNYPHDRVVNLEHMRLELSIPSMDEPRIDGREILTISGLAREATEFTLDAHAMTIRGVSCPGREAGYSYDGSTLSIRLLPGVKSGEKADVTIEYALDDPPDGLLWTPPIAEQPERTPQIHTQGEAESNSFWFPCHDYPNERLTTELVVTVPEGFMASSNGRLVSHEHRILDGASGGRKVEVWHWSQEKPHVAYLVSLVVGRFDVVDVGTPALPMPVYVPLGRGKDVPATYGRTPEMVSVFERLLDEPYPWARYAQLVVTNFNAGGMENTSATSMFDFAILSPEALIDHEFEGLISHELAHQWFGDLLTCNSWEHLWLNEGFATYLNGLWCENRSLGAGEPSWMNGREAYDAHVQGWFDGLIGGDRGELPGAVGMCSNVYANPGETFGRGSNPYPKGASILHMLRRKLGDEVFFRGLRLYVDRHALKTVQTSDLRYAMEEASGEGLEQFFTQWCTRPNLPRVTIKVERSEDRHVRVTASQTQKIDGDNPAFEFDLPLASVGASPSEQLGALSFRGKEASWEGELPQGAAGVAVDPDATTLAELTIEQDATAWTMQLGRGPTPYARMLAARALSKLETGASALQRTAEDAGAAPGLRVECVRSLATLKKFEVLDGLLSADRWEVREAVIGPLADHAKEGGDADAAAFGKRMIGVLGRDASQRVRCAAARAVGKLRPIGAFEALRPLLDRESQGDEVRQAAMEALVQVNSPECLRAAAPFCGPRYGSRTRALALDSVAKLSGHDKDFALETVSAFAGDRVGRVRRSACASLVEMKDPRGAALLEGLIAKERSERTRNELRGSVEKLRATGEDVKMTPVPPAKPE